MSNPDTDDEQAGPSAHLRARLEELRRQPKNARWAVFKDRVAIVAVILVLALFVFMMIDGSIGNFRCSFVQFITFECNRWDAKPKRWE